MKALNTPKAAFEVGFGKIVKQSSKLIKANSSTVKGKKGFLCSQGGLY